MAKQLRIGFDWNSRIVPVRLINLGHLEPVRRASPKHRQGPPSVREPVLRPLVVLQQGGKTGSFILVDGYWRLQALKEIARAAHVTESLRMQKKD